LEVENVAAGTVQDASIVVHRGEVVGVAGLVGCGKAQLGQLCFGLLKPTTGSIRINGSEVHRHSPSDRLAQGVVFYPADRKRDGLIETRSAAENATLAALPRWSPLGLIKRSSERTDAVDVLQRLNLRPMSPDALPSTFSGGNQQKIVLARGFAGDYDIHVFDEPTAGVDVGARSEIYLAIKDLAAAGAAVLIISSDLPEVVGLAHRAYVMCEGRVVGEFTGDQLQESTMLPAFFAHAQEGRSS
jgi:ribose transport system ATP-binding protein